MKILVTGGGGFLGKTILRQLLARGDSVRSLTRSPQPELAAAGVECCRGDIADADSARQACAGVDAVFHTAARAGVWGSGAEFFAANVSGTQNLLDACRANGVQFFVHTSTPSVVYSGGNFAGADEALPLTRSCSCAYPLTKAEAERRVLAANGGGDGSALRTVALRPHLIWGAGDPHLVPRVVHKARAGKLRIVGDGKNRVDLTHVENAARAHLLALDALCGRGPRPAEAVAGNAYFISDGAPVVLWEWINALLDRLGVAPVTRHVPCGVARFAGGLAECLWKALPLRGEPPLTRFVAEQLSHDHWFNIGAARRDLGYAPRMDTAAALDALVESLAA
ncbi:MAG: NAD-dependent epimerase/dehydratase family protein [Puniceicoccales bacterium]|jgi:nucleoside-diphosphate-sugar epimerase|nr:NAD-dependent epimerase/dehydratase family protein [Puniceicoccales bacterium]